MIRHAGLIARRARQAWLGVLILGASGAGKSDLALRALGQGFTLVADDRTMLFNSGRRLFGRAPDPLFGLIELRGLGVRRQTALPCAPIALIVRCRAAGEVADRMPESREEIILGVGLPVLDLYPFEPSAPEKLCRALEELGARGVRGYQACFAPPGRSGVQAWRGLRGLPLRPLA